MPSFVEPMLAKAVDELPVGPEWGYEPKIDGHRGQIRIDGPTIDIRTRNNKRPLMNVRSILAAAAKVPAKQALIDGEITALDENGLPSFQALQNRDPNFEIVFYAFDLPFFNGRDLQSEPLSARQELLAELIKGTGLGLCTALPGAAAKVTRAVRSAGFEGIVAKRQHSTYRSGDRTDDWQKKRFEQQQEFVIGGYRPAGRDSIDSLLVGVYEDGELKFASKVRPGLNSFNRAQLRTKLERLNSPSCPFVNLPTPGKRGKSSWDSGGVSADEMAEMQWVRPRLVAEIRFLQWTSSGMLRHPAFVALRDDKSAKDVVRET
jgi:bifunctional non-homologous end joining protein LigD